MYFFNGNSPVLTIVVPCFNEEAVLHETTRRLTEILDKLIYNNVVSKESTMMFVDDGSKDNTWNIIEELNRNNSFVKGVKLARNVGHQNALLAGLLIAKENADCVISIDADLQDDVNAIEKFMEKYYEGYEIVYGVREERKTDTFFKRNTAQAFYKLMAKMGVNIVYNHADYRLLSKRVLNHLSEFRESNLFLRGIIPLIGFKSINVYYVRNERFAGESKYPLKKMIKFAFDGITSFSIAPIRIITLIGFLFFFLSILTSVYAVIQKFIGNTLSGWTSIMLSIWFIGGFQLMGIGLVGEYIGKIFNEVKGRPKYIVEVSHYSNNGTQQRNHQITASLST
ncbi:glycosyltransferase family 2 protein [Neobacillus cucumis]|uniref:glycosyltransferase family 2 protein n=1 Tax=Neobacillus cucumis TaxID=1740721 RepID=UPI0019646F02|nr:glycosyltransferase family 2 protein [Neobacillus cucumis]MBM7651846.1 glycosyltransferase involved in cell wall biosynthesis [Neobacillus cucumis]